MIPAMAPITIALEGVTLAHPAVMPTNPAKAPWYFLGLQELVSYHGFIGGIVIPTAGGTARRGPA